MPVSNDEFEAGTVEVHGDEPIANDEEGPIETEKVLITSFLSERPDKAFTERERVLGVHFSPAFMNRTRHPLGPLSDGLIDFAGDVTATTIVINDIGVTLDELVEWGIVPNKEVETEDGTSVYYRLAEIGRSTSHSYQRLHQSSFESTSSEVLIRPLHLTRRCQQVPHLLCWNG